jgi:hypothetical protein
LQPSIKFHLAGRLGNQLFEWSFAHRVWKQTASQVQFTTDRFHHPKGVYEYELGMLECQHILAPKMRNLFGVILAVLDKFGQKATPLVKLLAPRLTREIDQSSVPVIIKDETRYISGFFIHKDYVEDVEEVVTSEICDTLRNLYLNRWRDSLPELYEAVHIRKGDFNIHLDTYGILSDVYYRLVIKGNLPLVIITENAEESSDLINFLKPVLVFDSSNSSAWDALAIMSHAKVLHTSNSTLSWWAGFASKGFGNKVTIPIPFYKSLNANESKAKFLMNGFESRDSTFI